MKEGEAKVTTLTLPEVSINLSEVSSNLSKASSNNNDNTSGVPKVRGDIDYDKIFEKYMSEVYSDIEKYDVSLMHKKECISTQYIMYAHVEFLKSLPV
ncbi:MAG: hypothetical protein K2J63_12470 [Muribaculaceae bacterium]|nr:hypothetical protein [Muribaculaceae bacterium]